jgi:hypothetical protein
MAIIFTFVGLVIIHVFIEIDFYVGDIIAIHILKIFNFMNLI